MKKWLNVRLYVDALRQLKLIGWMAFIVYMLEAVLLPLDGIRHEERPLNLCVAVLQTVDIAIEADVSANFHCLLHRTFQC